METTSLIYLEMKLESGNLVSGESAVGGYENRIDIESFQLSGSLNKQSLKELQKGDIHANLKMAQVTISKVFDHASLLLAGVLSRHERFEEVKISVDQQYIDEELTGKIRNEILIMYLYAGYVADIKLQTSEGDGGATIKESITLSFHNCTIYYYAEDRERAGKEAGKLGDDYRWEPCVFQTERPEQEA